MTFYLLGRGNDIHGMGSLGKLVKITLEWNVIVMPWIILINIKSARLLLLLRTNYVGFTWEGSHADGPPRHDM